VCSYGSVRAGINNACSIQLLVRSFMTGSRAAHTRNIWDHVESYVTHTSWPISRLFFYSPKIKLIISLLDPQPLLLVLTMLILVASARQAPYLACLRVLRLAIRPSSGAPDQGQTLDVWGDIQQMSTRRCQWHFYAEKSPSHPGRKSCTNKDIAGGICAMILDHMDKK
jgi:hypothetical protein